AAKGKIQVQAQSDSLEVTADKDVTVTSCKERITVAAKQEILLNVSGGAYIRIAGGNIELHCPGKVSVKGASHQMSGPTSLAKELNKMPSSKFDEEFVMKWPYDGKPVKGRAFKLIREDGTVIHGITDAEGKTGLQRSLFTENIKLHLLPEK
ncbi:hypothetical protein VK98_22310, partial [Chromobacterium sp. LK11]|uniref:DUF2345 domain-containing protein n=1 Tax=Chromobacterium sp. LK11 TaxID=1628212 RepID=UPI0006534698